MAGLDLFLLLTPILMLFVVALFVFVGCEDILGLKPTVIALDLQATPGTPPPNTRITPVNLNWTPASTVTVYRATDPNRTNYQQLTSASSDTSYTDPDVNDGTTYYYLVEGNGSYGYGGPASVTPQPPFVESFITLAGLRNDLSGYVGMAIRVGAANPVTVYALGRLMVAGNNGVHEVRVVDASNNSVVAAVGINMAGGTPNSFVYNTLLTPVTLTAGADYYVVSAEVSGGDQWHDDATTLATSGIASVTDSVFSFDGVNFITHSTNATYGPLDFLYF
jgi:hypothetical protein